MTIEEIYRTIREYEAEQKRKDRKYTYGVYLAVYPEGPYIGSGNIKHRRWQHLAGCSHITKKSGSKAQNFLVLLEGHRDYCYLIEGFLIDLVGLDNLLNCRGGPKVA